MYKRHHLVKYDYEVQALSVSDNTGSVCLLSWVLSVVNPRAETT